MSCWRGAVSKGWCFYLCVEYILFFWNAYDFCGMLCFVSRARLLLVESVTGTSILDSSVADDDEAFNGV